MLWTRFRFGRVRTLLPVDVLQPCWFPACRVQRWWVIRCLFLSVHCRSHMTPVAPRCVMYLPPDVCRLEEVRQQCNARNFMVIPAFDTKNETLAYASAVGTPRHEAVPRLMWSNLLNIEAKNGFNRDIKHIGTRGPLDSPQLSFLNLTPNSLAMLIHPLFPLQVGKRALCLRSPQGVCFLFWKGNMNPRMHQPTSRGGIQQGGITTLNTQMGARQSRLTSDPQIHAIAPKWYRTKPVYNIFFE